MNILCLCDGGFVRSVALAYVINTGSKAHCAIAGGMDSFERNDGSRRHFVSLMRLSDMTLVVSDEVCLRVEEVLKDFGAEHLMSNVFTLNIGPDRWGTKAGPYNEELLELCFDELKRVGIL